MGATSSRSSSAVSASSPEVGIPGVAMHRLLERSHNVSRSGVLKRSGAIAAVALVVLVSGVQADPGDAEEEAQPPAIPAIGEPIRRFVEAREVAGAMTLVATPDRVAHLDATGMADIAEGKPMR